MCENKVIEMFRLVQISFVCTNNLSGQKNGRISIKMQNVKFFLDTFKIFTFHAISEWRLFHIDKAFELDCWVKTETTETHFSQFNFMKTQKQNFTS